MAVAGFFSRTAQRHRAGRQRWHSLVASHAFRTAPNQPINPATDSHLRRRRLTTTLGDIDLLGEIVGGGGYEQLLPHSSEIPMFGGRQRCLNLDTLIRVKRAAGRPKDFDAIAELEALREERAAQ